MRELMHMDDAALPNETLATIFHPLTGVFGSEVLNVDLSVLLGADKVADLVSGLKRYKVLVFREQHKVGPAELLAVARHFGEPETAQHPTHADLQGYPGVKELISNLSDRSQVEVTENWHTDGATRKNTKAVSLLQAVDVPPYGRDTAFADMEAIFSSLSRPMQAMLEGLTAIHTYGPRAAHIPPVEHPVVHIDPATGRKSLYVSRLYTTRIIGLKTDESDALLAMLFAKTRLLEFQLRVSWRPGTIVIWDNEPTQHYLVFDRAYRRTMHRVMAL